MGKVMIHFTKEDFRYFAVLLAHERELWEECGDKEMVETLSEMHGRLLSCCVNDDCEVVIDDSEYLLG